MKITKVEDLRIANRRKILKEIRRKQQISRADLSKTLALNKGTVSTIIKELQDESLVVEGVTGDSSAGRKPIMLSLVNDTCFCISVYIQINKAKLMAVDFQQNILYHSEIELHQEFQPFYVLLTKELDKIVNQLHQRQLTGISIISIGSIDLEGIIRLIPDLNWRNIDFKNMLGSLYHVPVHVTSVGNLMAAYVQELNPQYQNLVVLSVDDTITSGTIVNGQAMKGFLGFASTIAHHVINKNEERICTCGKRGCFSQYCTNQALLEHYNKITTPALKSIDEFIEAYKNNDPIVRTIIKDYVDDMAVALANIIFIINPEVVILSGTILNELPQLLHEIYERIVLPVTYQDIILLSMMDQDLMHSAANINFDYYLDTK